VPLHVMGPLGYEAWIYALAHRNAH
jgi:hypothetical protein